MSDPQVAMPLTTGVAIGLAQASSDDGAIVNRGAGADALRHAISAILDRLDEPISVTRLARTTGLSTRTLYRLVRREYGMSPMSLVRRVRLLRARTDLEAACPGTTVTQTALHWGFVHLGRFSGEYARMFGEPPSITLRRARHAFVPPARDSRRVRRDVGFGTGHATPPETIESAV